MQSRLAIEGVEIANVSHRAKALDSFLEKCVRKSYRDPFGEIEDFAGVRVVYLYSSDHERIVRCLEDEFDIVNVADKRLEVRVDQFGYQAVHYIVKLGNKSSGARYDGIKDLVCEIQVRTVLQDAWAIINHHLVYKQEDDVPSQLKRKIIAVSAMFELADREFDAFRKERQEYITQIEAVRHSETEFLSQEVNADTLLAFFEWKFPGVEPYFHDGHRMAVLHEFPWFLFETLGDVNANLDRFKDSIDEYLVERSRACPGSRLAVMAAILDENYRNEGWDFDDILRLDALASRHEKE